MAEHVSVPCTVNGARVTFEGHPMSRLLDALRTQLHLTGTKEGCGEGECGACSVLLNGELANSCLVPLLHADGAAIRTIEDVAPAGALHPVQEAFIACGGAQCGICTPGMILATISLLEQHPSPTDAQIQAGLAGNLCRCTGYMRIFEAVRTAANDSGLAAWGAARGSGLGARDSGSGLGARDSGSGLGLGTRDSGLGTRPATGG